MTGPARPALEAKGVWFGYGRDRPVLRGVDLCALPGELTLILGVSGSGKTTLLKLCRGLQRVRSGSIEVLGRPVVAHLRGRLDPQVAYIPQQLGLVRSASALENVLAGALSRVATIPSLFGFPSREVERARGILAGLGIDRKAPQPVHALSGGERQRVAIARALMQGARLILADEFVSQLDPVTTEETMVLMRGIAQQGVAVVQTTHELEVAERHADLVVVLRDGTKVMESRAVDRAEIARALRL